MTRWLLAALLVFSGCAYALSGPEPGRPRNQVPECDTSKGLVVLDGAMATTMGVVTLSMVSGTEPAVALLPLAIGAIYLGGAVKGNAAVNRCRVAMDEYARYPGDRFVADDADDDRPRRSASRVENPTVQAAMPQAPPSRPAPAPQAQPALQPPAQPAPARPQPADGETDWSDFWREVP